LTNNNQFTKDPNDVLDYQISWASWLGASETIDTSMWIVPDGIVKNSDTATTTTTTIWLSGGINNTPFMVTNRIITNQGRTKDQSLLIQVVER